MASKIIRGNRVGAEPWQPPEMSQKKVKTEEVTAPPLLTAAQLEKLQQEAQKEGFELGRKEGFELGHREGLEQGQAEIAQKSEQATKVIEQFEALLQTLNEPFEVLDDQVEQEILELVVAVVRQLVRREIKTDPGQIIGVVREALAILPSSSRNIRVQLHPEDADLVREAYALGDGELKWDLVEDPTLARGGCRVLTEMSQVDATLESRLNALIAPLLAGERSKDETETTK